MTSAPSHHKLSALSHATKNARATERLTSNAQTSPVGIPPPVFEALFDDQPVELSRRSRTRRQKRARSISGSGMTQPFYLSACDSPDHPTSATQVAFAILSINVECPLVLLGIATNEKAPSWDEAFAVLESRSQDLLAQVINQVLGRVLVLGIFNSRRGQGDVDTNFLQPFCQLQAHDARVRWVFG